MKKINKTNYVDWVFRISLLTTFIAMGAFFLTVGLGVAVSVAVTIFAPIVIPLIGVFICLSCIFAHRNQIPKELTKQKIENASYRLKLAQEESERLSREAMVLNQELNAILSATTTMNMRLQQDIESDAKAVHPAKPDVERMSAHVRTFTGRKNIGLDKISSDPENAKDEIDAGLSKLLEEQNITERLLKQRADQMRLMQKRGL